MSDPNEALAMASLNGLIDLVSQEEFEREMRFRIAHGATDWADAWTDDERIQRAAELDPAAQRAMDEKKWHDFINDRYDAYWQAKAAEWQDATRRMDRAYGAVKEGLAFELAGATIAVGAGLGGARVLATGGSTLGRFGKWLASSTIGRLFGSRAAVEAVTEEAAGEAVGTEAAAGETVGTEAASETTPAAPAEPTILTEPPEAVGEGPYRAPGNQTPDPGPDPEPPDPWSRVEPGLSKPRR